MRAHSLKILWRINTGMRRLRNTVHCNTKTVPQHAQLLECLDRLDG